MTSKFQRMWEESERKIRNYERVHNQATATEINLAALKVINRHNLSEEFVEELLKPKPKT